MSLIDDYEFAQKQMRATGVYNKNNSVDNDILAFDLSSQNYDAAGAEGWANRMKSLNLPMALVDTWNGVVKNNAIKNPDADFLTSVRDNLLGYTGGILKGAFATTGILEPIAKGAVLTVGSVIDELNNPDDTDTMLDKVRKSWDLAYTTEYFSETPEGSKQSIGLGEALLWTMGRAANAFAGDSMTKKEMLNAGIGFANDDFDIFTKEDSDTMMSGLGQIVQPLNFAGELLDITGFSGIARKSLMAVGKGLNLARFGAAGSKWEASELAKMANGLVSKYDGTADDFLTLDLQGKKNWLVSKGIAEEEKIGQYSILLDSAKTKTDVANIILAVDHRSLEHINRVAKSLGKENWLVNGVLDGLSNNGTLARTSKELTENIDSAVSIFKTEEEMAQSWVSFIDNMVDDLSGSGATKEASAASALKDLTTSTVDNVTSFAALKTLRETGFGTSKLQMLGIKMRSKLLEENTFWKKIEYSTNIPGLPRVIKFVRNAGKIHTKGEINFDLEPGVALQKMEQYLGQINDYTKGAFKADGRLDNYYNRLLESSNNPKALKELYDELSGEVIQSIKGKRNKNVNLINSKAIELGKGYQLAKKQIDEIIERGKGYSPNHDAVITSEGFEKGIGGALTTAKNLEDETNNIRYMLDIDELDSLVAKSGGAFEQLFWYGQDVKNGVNRFMHWWSNILLARVSRFSRERLANLPGYIWTLMAGEYTDLLGKNARRGLANMIENLPNRIGNGKESLKLKFDNNLRNTARLNQQLSGLRGNATEVINHYENLKKAAISKIYDDAAEVVNLSDEDLQYVAVARIVATEEQVHIAGSKNPKSFNSDNMVPTSKTGNEALSWKQDFEDNNILNTLNDEDLTPERIAEIATNMNYTIIVEVDGRYFKVDTEHFINNADSYKDFNVGVVSKDWKKAETQGYKVYGEHIDLTDETIPVPEKLAKALEDSGFNSVDEYKDWVNSGQHKLNACGRGAGLVEALTAAGIGTVTVAEGVGRTVFSNPNLMETPLNNPIDNLLDSYILDAQEEIVKRRTNFDLKTKSKIDELDMAAVDELNRIRASVNSGNAEPLSSVVKEYTERINYYKNLRSQVDERLDKIASVKSKTRKEKGLQDRISEGTVAYRGTRFNNFAEGKEGIEAAARLSPTSTYDEIYASNKIDKNTLGRPNNLETVGMPPTNPDYFNGLAAWLQVYGRGDDVFTMLASGKSEEEVVYWLSKTAEGRAYSDRMKIGRKYDKVTAINKAAEENDLGWHQDLESYVAERANLAGVQIFNDEVKSVFFGEGPITGDALRQALKDQENLPEIIGEIFNPQMHKKITSSISEQFRKFNKVLVEQPQQILENLPVATAVYQRRMQEMIDNTLEATGRETLSVAEINTMEKVARAWAIKYTRKMFYNVQSQSNLSAAISTFVPFVTAYTFTIKQFANGMKNNPAATLWLMSGLQKSVGEMNWVDENGEPTDITKANSLVIPLNEDLANSLKNTWLGSWFGDTNELRVSARSLNVWFGGEVIPGPGPLISVPVSELVKGNTVVASEINKITKGFLPFLPSDEGFIDYLIPMGPSDKPLSYDMLLPTWINNAADAGAFTNWINPEYRGQQYLDSFAKTSAYLSVKARMKGGDEPLPTKEEIEEKVNALYGLKFISSFVSPASFQVKTEVDLARQVYNQYIKRYGQDQADWYFQQDHPELLSGMSSIYSGEYGLSPDAVTMKNLDTLTDAVTIFSQAPDASKDMLGFFMNNSKNPEFDDYAWTYLQNKSPSPGEPAYYSKLSAADAGRRAAEAVGWVYFNKMESAVDAEALERNVDAKKDPKIVEMRKEMLDQLAVQYPEWYTAYKDTNTNKWNDRAITVTTLLNEPQWRASADPNLVDSLDKFVSTRQQIISILDSRDTKSLTSKKNKDVYDYYTAFIYDLKNNSIRFSDFYNRYFENDTLR